MKARSKLRESHRHIFIIEDLTIKKAKLFAEARLFKKDKKVNDVWTYDG